MTALALRDDQTQWDSQQLAALRQTGIDEDISEAELQVFLHECQRRKLDPFSRQIYLIGRYDSQQKRKVYRSQTGIDGFRVIARRAADEAKETIEYEETLWCGPDRKWTDVWLENEPPAACKVVVLRDGKRFPATAKYFSYVQTNGQGHAVGLWRKMPDNQLAKCTEALALRKAFPEDLGGIYTEEEMAQADNPQRVQATVEVVRDDPPEGHNGDATADGQRWAEDAITRAASFKTEAEGQKLWRESAAAVIDGRATPGQATHIQNIISARITDRRKEAAARQLSLLSEADPWREKVEGLTSDDEAREALRELAALTPDQVDMTRAQRISRAIIALFPKAAIQDAA